MVGNRIANCVTNTAKKIVGGVTVVTRLRKLARKQRNVVVGLGSSGNKKKQFKL